MTMPKRPRDTNQLAKMVVDLSTGQLDAKADSAPKTAMAELWRSGGLKSGPARVTRLTGASKNTVTKLLIDAGKACAAYDDEHVRDLTSKRIQVDDIWSFTYAKQKEVGTAKSAPEQGGATWTWTAIDADTKLIASYLMGGRDCEYAIWFMGDLRSRLANRVQLTSDGHRAYLEAVEGAFGADVDAQLVKLYGASPEGPTRRYSPAECTGAKKVRVEGNPDPKHVSTSYAERSNLTIRMHMRQFTRLTNAFSKKVENHAYAVALNMMYYNFVRNYQKLRVTPAMAAGITDKLWEIGDIAKLVEDAEVPAKKRGSYKKREIAWRSFIYATSDPSRRS